MTRRRAMWLVARREIVERGRSRAFVVSLLLTVAFIVAGAVLPTLLGGPGAVRLGIVGTPPPAFGPSLLALTTQANVNVTVETVPDAATGEASLKDGSLDGLLIVPPGAERPTYVVTEDRRSALGQLVAAAWSAARVADVLGEAGISPQELQAAMAPPTVRELQPSDPTRDTSFLFANVGVILLFISIFTFGTWVLTGVVEEKQSRVVEVVLSTVEPRDLLVGKVFGMGVLGLVQLTVMVSVGLAAALAVGRITLPPTTPGAIAQLVLWFVLGYAFYSTALAVLGALASRMEEASNASSPVSILATVAYVFSLVVVLDDPAGTPARIASLIPPVAPMVVPMRAALGAIEPWEIALSVALMVVTIWALFIVGGRVYAGAVLRLGGRVRLRDAWRAAGE